MSNGRDNYIMSQLSLHGQTHFSEWCLMQDLYTLSLQKMMIASTSSY